jgi:hypothetical protein
MGWRQVSAVLMSWDAGLLDDRDLAQGSLLQLQ